MARKYWLLKSEPDAFSIDDLKRVQVEPWDGVRNYQARNLLRDELKKGDLALFYHSAIKVPAAVGICEIVKEGYPDPSAWDPKAKYYDAKSDPDNPRWFMVDVKYKKHLKNPVPLSAIKADQTLSEMVLVRRGRLSVQPVLKEEWDAVLEMSKQSWE